MKKLIPVFILLGMLVMSCGGKEDCVTTDLTYTSDIKSLVSGCAASGCHESGSASGSMASYDDLVAFVGFGRIEGAINHEAGFSPMPQNGDKLSDCNISKIEAWIADGMPE